MRQEALNPFCLNKTKSLENALRGERVERVVHAIENGRRIRKRTIKKNGAVKFGVRKAIGTKRRI